MYFMVPNNNSKVSVYSLFRPIAALKVLIYSCTVCFRLALERTRRLSENRNLLRKSGFWSIFPIKFVQYNKYSPHLIEPIIIKMADSKPLSLATASILGQPPREQAEQLPNTLSSY
jgi:hypothetical protein